jgi:hypothetical protein
MKGTLIFPFEKKKKKVNLSLFLTNAMKACEGVDLKIQHFLDCGTSWK